MYIIGSSRSSWSDSICFITSRPNVINSPSKNLFIKNIWPKKKWEKKSCKRKELIKVLEIYCKSQLRIFYAQCVFTLTHSTLKERNLRLENVNYFQRSSSYTFFLKIVEREMRGVEKHDQCKFFIINLMQYKSKKSIRPHN